MRQKDKEITKIFQEGGHGCVYIIYVCTVLSKAANKIPVFLTIE